MRKCTNKPGNEQFEQLPNVGAIYISLRNIKKINNSNKVRNIYNVFISETYRIFKENGFIKIDIKGDRTYGILEDVDANKYGQYKDTIKELNKLQKRLKDTYSVRTTISLNIGNEVYGCFGKLDNDYRTMVFIGNILSDAKRNVDKSDENIELIVNKKIMVT